jgi:hypothetical protein
MSFDFTASKYLARNCWQSGGTETAGVLLQPAQRKARNKHTVGAQTILIGLRLSRSPDEGGIMEVPLRRSAK